MSSSNFTLKAREISGVPNILFHQLSSAMPALNMYLIYFSFSLMFNFSPCTDLIYVFYSLTFNFSRCSTGKQTFTITRDDPFLR